MKTKKRRIRRVTLLPGWVLRLKGRIHARYGASVVSAYIGRLLRKLCSLEDREVLETEKALYPTRDTAANCLTTISREANALSQMPDAVPENSDIAIRTNQRNAAAVETHKNTISACTRTITSANELIINGVTILEGRIATMRAKTEEKILQYIAGVRKKLPDYTFDLNAEENTAVDIYVANHRVLDNAISKLAYKTINEEE